MNTVTTEDVARLLLGTIPKVNRSLRTLIFSLTKSSLSMPQYRVLSLLNDAGALPMANLADQEGVQAPTMSRFIDALVQKGFVTREKTDLDKRSIRANLTPEGAAVVQKVRQYVIESLQESTTDWPLEDLEIVAKAMSILKEHQLDRNIK